MNIQTADFETLLDLAEQMPRERFEALKIERPDFNQWLEAHRTEWYGTPALDYAMTHTNFPLFISTIYFGMIALIGTGIYLLV